MAHGLNVEYWDYVVGVLVDRGVIDKNQASQAKNLGDGDKFRFVNDYVSEESWERIDNDVAPAVLDFLGVDYDEDEYSNYTH